ncbi:MAG: UbiD family decarboxylase [Caldilineae bacterium]|nr:MAG: UbiD family decarboxylase [Caldilineae bacterium]
MNLHEFIAEAERQGWLHTVAKRVSVEYELAAVAYALDGYPVLFERVMPPTAEEGTKPYPYRVLSGLASHRRHFALALACAPDELLHRLAEALEHPRPAPLVEHGPCQEVVERPADLTTLPILRHWPEDAGPYATAAVAIIRDPDTGLNASYHRLLRLDERRFVARLVENRGAHTAWQKCPQGLPVAICIGLPLHVLLAASMAPPPGVSELDIAHGLKDTPLVSCLTHDLPVPAEAEFVLEGRITHQLADEGPFVDLTETGDIVRRQPIVEIECITHRRNAIYHALLPGQLEHKLLMGMPREPGIFSAVNQVVCCRNVHITPGGASWLHAVVQIQKQHPDDGRKAIEAAFRGHSSLKHVVVVDEDIDIFSPDQVEWAIATRFQAGRDLYIFRDRPSSSLDPSARHTPGRKSRSDKMGLDATIPWDTPTGPSEPEHYRRLRLPVVDPTPYLASQPDRLDD